MLSIMKEEDSQLPSSSSSPSTVITKLPLRPYQERVIKVALTQNTLAVLPTGSGKTLIAVHVIQERLRLIRLKKEEEGSRRSIIIFLAPTKVLVGQQKAYIQAHSDACIIEITSDTNLTASYNKRHWGVTGWSEWLLHYEVIVMTPQILNYLLQKKLFDASLLDTLVVDECHHACRNNPLVAICRELRNGGYHPLILAITASPVQCKTDSIWDEIKTLEMNLGCQMIYSKEIIEEYRTYSPAASLSTFRYSQGYTSSFSRVVASADAIQTTSAIDPLNWSNDDSKLNLPVEIDVAAEASTLLLYAYLRIRHTNLIKLIYGYMNTMLVNPDDVAEISSLNLPDLATYRIYSRGLFPADSESPVSNQSDFTGNKKPIFNPSQHLLSVSYSPFFSLGDAVLSIGQVLSIAEECGMLSGIYALILVIEDQILGKVSPNGVKKVRYKRGTRKSSNKKQSKSDNKIQSNKAIARKNFQSASLYIKETHFNMDADKLSGAARELKRSPFNLVDLFHDQYIMSVSLLDYLYAFFCALGPTICKRACGLFIQSSKPCRGPITFYIDPDTLDIEGGSSRMVGISRMNAIICLLFRDVALGGGLRRMNLSPEGCLTQIFDVLRSNPIFDQFRLSLDVCGEAVRRSCWCLLRALSVAELREWIRMDEDLRYCSFEPLLEEDPALETETNFETNMTITDDWKLNHDLNTEAVLHSFPPISNKLKALCNIWLQLSDDKDFTLHWSQNRKAMVEGLLNHVDERMNDDVRYGSTGVVLAQVPMQEEEAQNELAASVPTNTSYIVFCRRRLIARSIHFVMSVILENNALQELELMESCDEEESSKENDYEVEGQPVSSAEKRQDATVQTVLEEMIHTVVKQNTDHDDVEEAVFQTVDSMIQTIEDDEQRKDIQSVQLISLPSFRPTHLVGGMKQSHQLRSLAKFKSGEVNIVFATDVMEEGLDLQACKYVINFDLPLNVKSFIQRKGRSRADNSMMISLVSYGIDGALMINELQQLIRQERAIEDYTGGVNAKQHPPTKSSEGQFCSAAMDIVLDDDDWLEDLVKTQEIQMSPSNWDCNDRDDGSIDEGESNAFNHLNGDIPCAPSNEMLDAEDESYIVPQTLAQVDSRSAIHLLINFCQQLPHDLVFSCRPIFWMERAICSDRQKSGFRCSILLPSCLPPSIRFIVGHARISKAKAKRSAALLAIKLLHCNGELDDWLRVFGVPSNNNTKVLEQVVETNIDKSSAPEASTQAVSIKKMSKQNMDSSPDLQNSGPGKNSVTPEAHYSEPIHCGRNERQQDDESNIIKILVKSIPDLLTLPASVQWNDGKRFQLLHFYSTHAVFDSARSENAVLECGSCSASFDGINNVTIAFSQSIPTEILAQEFRCQVREYETVFVHLCHVCSKWVSDEELYHLQRFHRAILCWETEYLLDCVAEQGFEGCFTDDKWIPHNAQLIQPSLEKMLVTEHDMWRESSGGAWYLLYPSIGNSSFPQYLIIKDHQERLEILADLIISSDWLLHIVRAADEAQILCHNLHIQRALNCSAGRGMNNYEGVLQEPVPYEKLVGLLVTHGPETLSYVHKDNTLSSYDSTRCKKLDDVMKYIPDPVREEVFQNLRGVVMEVERMGRTGHDVAESIQPTKDEENSESPSLKRRKPFSIPDENKRKLPRTDWSSSPRSVSLARCSPIEEAQASRKRESSNLSGLSHLVMRPLLYWERFYEKFPECRSSIMQWREDPNHRLIKTVSVSGLITLNNFIGKFIVHLKRSPEVLATYGNFLPAKRRRSQTRLSCQQQSHTHSNPLFLPQQLLRPIGKHQWMLLGLSAPTVVWRLQSLLLATEGRQAIFNITIGSDDHQDVSSLPPPLYPVSLNKTINLSLILEAFTPRLCREVIDLERLELLGDTILKFVTSVEVFRVYPRKHEGFLTFKRSQLISNRFLIGAALKMNLERYIRTSPLSFGKKKLHARPPGMTFNAIKEGRSLWNENITTTFTAPNGMEGFDGKAEESSCGKQFGELHNQDVLSFSSSEEFYQSLYPQPCFQSAVVNPKVIADVMEAIIGAFYVDSGISKAVEIIRAFGAWPQAAGDSSNSPSFIEQFESISCFVEQTFRSEDLVFPENYPIALQRIALGRMRVSEEMLDQEQILILPERVCFAEEPAWRSLAENMKPDAIIQSIASICGYTFQYWSVLEEALTHCSVQNRTNNQRLEFLGDAVLDLAVISMLFNEQPWATQGDLSYQKSQATCNRNLGDVATRLKLFYFLRHASPGMEAEFDRLHAFLDKGSTVGTVTTDTTCSSDIEPNKTFMLPNKNSNSQDGVFHINLVLQVSNSALKALADLLEALIGAMFIDSGGSLECVMKVVRHINLLPQLNIRMEQPNTRS